MSRFDVHFASQGFPHEEAEKKLEEAGFRSDRLNDNHVRFGDDHGKSSCALIGLHMTKKTYEGPPLFIKAEIRRDMELARRTLVQYGLAGYAHAEYTDPRADVTIRNPPGSMTLEPWPLERFNPEYSSVEKRWDIHLAIPLEHLSPELAALLSYGASGFMSIDLSKSREGREFTFRVFTVQGSSSPKDGRALFTVLREWFERSRVPWVEIKQETYLGMFRVGDADIVPPTVKGWTPRRTVSLESAGQR